MTAKVLPIEAAGSKPALANKLATAAHDYVQAKKVTDSYDQAGEVTVALLRKLDQQLWERAQELGDGEIIFVGGFTAVAPVKGHREETYVGVVREIYVYTPSV